MWLNPDKKKISCISPWQVWVRRRAPTPTFSFYFYLKLQVPVSCSSMRARIGLLHPDITHPLSSPATSRRPVQLDGVGQRSGAQQQSVLLIDRGASRHVRLAETATRDCSIFCIPNLPETSLLLFLSCNIRDSLSQFLLLFGSYVGNMHRVLR